MADLDRVKNMKLLLGVLLSFGLLLQAFDIVASVPHKNFIKTRFVETSSRLRTYSSREIALWALIGFSRKLDGWFGPNVLSRRTLQSLCLVHFILFSSFSFLLAYALSSESRRVTYGWAFSAAELSPDALDKLVAWIKQINPAFPDLHYDLFMSSMNLFKPIIAILFLFFALLTSCIFSYLSLDATRLLLRRAIAGKTVVSLVLFIFVDCTIASLLMVSFAVLSVVIVLAILQLIGVKLGMEDRFFWSDDGSGRGLF